MAIRLHITNPVSLGGATVSAAVIVAPVVSMDAIITSVVLIAAAGIQLPTIDYTIAIVTSYDTVANADIYFKSRLYVEAWDDASTPDKTTALAEASLRIDRLRFSGYKVADTQGLEFPRYYGDTPDGTETIPNDIKIACFEIAHALLDGVDPEVELENLNVRSEAFSSVKTSYHGVLAPEHFAAGIPSAFAWSFLRPYLATSDSVRLNRV